VTLRQFRPPLLWLALWIFGWALCITLSLLPPIALPGPEDSDKLGHFLAYFTLSLWAVLIFRQRRSHFIAAIALVLLGASIEWAQATLTQTRHGDPADLLANTLGILSGLALSFAGTRIPNFLVALDTKLFRRS
jgi:VanZ family protein